MKYVTGLQCLRCENEHATDPLAYVCRDCGDASETDDAGVLDVRYDYDAARRALASEAHAGRRDVFRYLPVLPVGEPGPVLPAGGTPLIEAPRLAERLGLRSLFLKDETRNPTRCLKDRATAIAVTLAVARGFSDVYCASAGNAAISLAGFAAHAGLDCHVFVPSYASEVRLGWLRRYGADVRVSDGDYDQAYAEAEAEGRANGWYSRNCALNPFLVEGKKTAALEIADQLEGRAPDWVVAPVGDGCTLGAIGKGFREAETLGRLSGRPRLLGVQAEAVQPLVGRFGGAALADGESANGAAGPERTGTHATDGGDGAAGPDGETEVATDGTRAGSDTAEPGGRTEAVSMAVRRPRNAIRVLNEVRASGGTMVAVGDTEIAEAQGLLAREAGMVAEFTGAATLAGLLRLSDDDGLAGQTIVLVITGGRLDESPGGATRDVTEDPPLARA